MSRLNKKDIIELSKGTEEYYGFLTGTEKGKPEEKNEIKCEETKAKHKETSKHHPKDNRERNTSNKPKK